MRSRTPTPLTSKLRIVSSLAALGAALVVLVGDSSDCPDGYQGVTFEANVSLDAKCSPRFKARQGRVRWVFESAFVTEKSDQGGLPISGVSDSHRSIAGSERCEAFRATFSLDGLSCAAVEFGKAEQTVTCSRKASSTPWATKNIGTRAMDASLGDAAPDDAAISDASASDAAPDASEPDTSKPDASTDPDDRVDPNETCDLTFTKPQGS